MKRTGSVTIVITAFLASTCFMTTRADRTDLTAALPSAGVGRPSLQGEPLFDTIRRAYADMDLPIRQRTWDRLVREAITMNNGLVQNPDLVQPRNPEANQVAEGTELQVPAVVPVREGDKGIGKVLLRLRPELKHDRKALIRAIKAVIVANADVIRNADVDQLVSGDYNVIQVGDLLVIPGDVLPAMPAPPAETAPVQVAELPPALEPEEETVEAPVVALIDTPVDDEIEEPATVPEEAEAEEPVAVAQVEPPVPDEAAAMPTPPDVVPVEQPTLPGIVETAAEEPVFAAEATMPLAPALPAPPEPVEPVEPTIEEPVAMPAPPDVMPVETTSLAGIVDSAAEEPVFTAEAEIPLAPAIPAPPEPVTEEPAMAAVIEEPVVENPAPMAVTAEPVATVAQTEPAPAEPAEPTVPTPPPAVAAVQPNGPIGLTARETQVFGQEQKKVSKLTGTHLMLAYLAAGLAAFGFLVLLVLRWLERDKSFRAQVSLLLGVSIFLITFGKVKRLPAVEWDEGEKKADTLPETDEARQEN